LPKDCDDLLQKARSSPQSLRFSEVCRLAECYGFRKARQSGSHAIYKRPGIFSLMNFQNDKGMAKQYQVEQLLAFIDGVEP